MKTLVPSDVHANITALEAVWNRESDADPIVCAGDLVDYGPHPRECLDWMIAHDVRAVMGNHDLAVIAAHEQPAAGGPLLWRMEKTHTYRCWAPRPGNEPAAVATASKAVSPRDGNKQERQRRSNPQNT